MKWFKRRGGLALLLLPLAALYWLITTVRRQCYQLNIIKTPKFSVPIIVVGNITVGGTGKTPTVIALSQWLQSLGFYPGIISRGYKGKAPHYPLAVTATTDPAACGDEPLLIAQQTRVPVVVDPKRCRGAQYLLEQNQCNVVLSDDGLQHYALPRDIEIALINGEQGFGNGWLLPAGPLRETRARLRLVDYVLAKNNARGEHYQLNIVMTQCYELLSGKAVDMANFRGQQVHAVAGIAFPEDFFQSLRERGLRLIEHPFLDHYAYGPRDLNFADDLPVIMTEKDAIKCQGFAKSHWYALKIHAEIPSTLLDNLKTRIKGLSHGHV